MTTYTDNLGLAKPNFNLVTWHDFINGNFDILDEIFTSATGFPHVKVWKQSTAYVVDDLVYDLDTGELYTTLVAHTSGVGDFFSDRVANPTFWGYVGNGFTYRGAWTTLTVYRIGDMVYDAAEFVLAVCTSEHTSTIGIRVDAAEWDFIFDIDTWVDTDVTMAADSDSKVPSQKAVRQYIADNASTTPIDTDGTFAANSDAVVPSQKAAKTYVDAAIAALRDGVAAGFDTLAEIATAIGTITANGWVTMTRLATGLVVTEGETIAANDNDTTLPTSAAVKDYTDTAITTGTASITDAMNLFYHGKLGGL